MTFSIATVALFAAAAGVGAVLRYLVGLALNRDFPTGTLTVNIVASVALGYLVGRDLGEQLTFVVGVGALGALSTWSSAANEAAVMAREDEGQLAIVYLVLSVCVCVLGAWIGLKVGGAA